MKAFNNSGNNDDYKPIEVLSNGKYLVNFGKITQLTEEKIMKNSRLVGTGKMVPTGMAIWRSILFDVKPSVSMIQNAIFNIINNDVQKSIKDGLNWKGYSVYLTLENQMNYKNSFDLALATNGENLPVTFKFSKKGKSEYYTFDNVNELKDFYMAVNNHINTCLENGWKEKDKFNPNDYKL
jgi:hypothetical protein